MDAKEPTIPEVNPDNPHLLGIPRWIRIADLSNIHYVPYIHDDLLDYIGIGKFPKVHLGEPPTRDK